MSVIFNTQPGGLELMDTVTKDLGHPSPRLIGHLYIKYPGTYQVCHIEVHASNPNIWEAEPEGCEFEGSLGYKVRPYLKKKTEKNKVGAIKMAQPVKVLAVQA